MGHVGESPVQEYRLKQEEEEEEEAGVRSVADAPQPREPPLLSEDEGDRSLCAGSRLTAIRFLVRRNR